MNMWYLKTSWFDIIFPKETDGHWAVYPIFGHLVACISKKPIPMISIESPISDGSFPSFFPHVRTLSPGPAPQFFQFDSFLREVLVCGPWRRAPSNNAGKIGQKKTWKNVTDARWQGENNQVPKNFQPSFNWLV